MYQKFFEQSQGQLPRNLSEWLRGHFKTERVVRVFCCVPASYMIFSLFFQFTLGFQIETLFVTTVLLVTHDG